MNKNELLFYITNYASVDLLNEETKIYADFLNKKDDFNVAYKKLINIYYNQYRSIDYGELYDYSNTASDWGDEMPNDLNYIMQQLAVPIKRIGDYKTSHEVYKYLIVTYGLKYDLLFAAWYKVLVSAMMFEKGSVVLVSGVNMFNNAFLNHRKYPYRGEYGPTTCQQHAIRLEAVLTKEKSQYLNKPLLNYLKIASGNYSYEIKEQLTKSDESIFLYLKSLSGNDSYEMKEIDLDNYDKFSVLNYRTAKMQNFIDYFS